MATRDGYLPVGLDERGNDIMEEDPIETTGAKRRSSEDYDYKSKKFISFWTFSLLVLLVSVMFLLGICIGFYVRELQKDDVDLEKVCGTKSKTTTDLDTLGLFHETLVYFIRGKKINTFVEEYGTDDPVTGSNLEERLANVVLEKFDSFRLDSVDVEEHDIVVTSSDPQRPNELQILHHNRSRLHHMVLTNNEFDTENSSDSGSPITGDWMHPFVAFSPSGSVEANLVYGHFGQETDFMILLAQGIEVKDKIILLRMGKLSVAEKIFNCESHGVKAVLLYWEPQDHLDETNLPLNASYIPYASAATYSNELPTFWTPSIPCQTVSSDQAAILITLLATETNSVLAPEKWQGEVASAYYFGGNSQDASIISLSVYNIPSRKSVKNIISTIQGIEEPDRYVIVGAPRTSLPGEPQDVTASISILTQLAESFHHLHNLHYWKPRRGVKLVSWGGVEFSSAGMLHYIKNHHHMLDRRAVTYFDIKQLAIGSEMITAKLPPGLHQLVKEATFDVPDPKNPEQTLQTSWKLYSEENNSSEVYKNIPLDSYSGDCTQNPFLHVLGVPTVHLQYRGAPGSPNSVAEMTKKDQSHHFKFHIAVTRILVLSLLSLLDNQVLPFSIKDAAQNLQLSVWQTSGILEDCSDDMENLYPALDLCEKLSKATEGFEKITDVFVERSDSARVLMINDIKMLFERLFIVHRNGLPHHVMYPALNDGSISIATELCNVGQIIEIWNVTSEFGLTLENVMKEAVTSLSVSS